MFSSRTEFKRGRWVLSVVQFPPVLIMENLKHIKELKEQRVVPRFGAGLGAGRGHPGPSLGVWASLEKRPGPPRQGAEARERCGASGVGSSPTRPHRWRAGHAVHVRGMGLPPSMASSGP